MILTHVLHRKAERGAGGSGWALIATGALHGMAGTPAPPCASPDPFPSPPSLPGPPARPPAHLPQPLSMVYSPWAPARSHPTSSMAAQRGREGVAGNEWVHSAGEITAGTAVISKQDTVNSPGPYPTHTCLSSSWPA